ncbi:MAG TPA: hypothetical protein VFZ03_11700 [Dongiaceae bacterium]
MTEGYLACFAPQLSEEAVPGIQIPESHRFIEDLILQRTGPFIRLGGAAALSKWMASGQKSQLFDFLIASNLLRNYLDEALREISDDVDALVSSVPLGCFGRVVSIGAGNGILELLMMRRMPVKALLLVDIEESDVHQHGFAPHGSGYASLRATKDFLIANGIDADSILVCNPRTESLSIFPCDLIMSILSMGFHYPCDEYAGFILQSLQNGGQAVFDKRRGKTDHGYAAIGKTLRLVKSIPFQKSDRMFFQR